ncbi:hypothetical protein PG997_000868 [Apiospora hydei]|uniref:Uncharacterized protein n=1 Tax=Apiospora hydei TaxID=1337664 RepID=A0ABR1XC71_9PEZI
MSADKRGLRLEMQSWIDLYRHQCAVTPTNSDRFHDAKLLPSIYLPNASSPRTPYSGSPSSATTTSTLENRQGSPPFSHAPASPPQNLRPHQQPPHLANNRTPTTAQKPVSAAPVNSYAQYENVAGNLTNELRCQQTYQMAALYQLHQHQSFTTWPQYAQAQQGYTRYSHQYQQQY